LTHSVDRKHTAELILKFLCLPVRKLERGDILVLSTQQHGVHEATNCCTKCLTITVNH